LLNTIFIICLIILLPAKAYANGGGPLLLILNAYIFVVGQVWIAGSETYVYKRNANLSLKESLKEVVLINLISTVVVGLGFPFILAVIGGIGSFLPEPIGPLFFLLGTWIVDKVPYDINLLPYVMAVGFVATYFLTVFFESWCLNKYWKRKKIETTITAKKLSWYANSVSYGGLVAISGIYYLFTNN
jgi:hypothetical protein